MVSLPPLTAVQFNQKVLESQKEAVANDQQIDASCNICQKSYSSVGGLESHLKSKKHLEMQKKYQLKNKDSIITSDMVSTVSSLSHSNPSRTTASLGGDSVHEESYRSRLAKATTQEQVEAILVEKMETCHRLTPRDCLFCPSEGFGNVEETLMHMATQHCFFVPDAEFLSDPEGLVQYLADKIAVANVCIFCNGKGRTMHSTEAVRAHMISKSHCKIPFEDGDEDEIAEFYEYANKDDDQWQDQESDDDEEEEFDDDQIVDLDDLKKTSSRAVTGPIFDDIELVLPSGVRIGHRAFRRYWSQNLRPERQSTMADTRDLSKQYRQLGMSNIPANALAQRSNGSALIHLTRQERLELRVQKREERKRMYRQQDHTARVGQKHNMLQHHYREQNPF